MLEELIKMLNIGEGATETQVFEKITKLNKSVSEMNDLKTHLKNTEKKLNEVKESRDKFKCIVKDNFNFNTDNENFSWTDSIKKVSNEYKQLSDSKQEIEKYLDYKDEFSSIIKSKKESLENFLKDEKNPIAKKLKNKFEDADLEDLKIIRQIEQQKTDYEDLVGEVNKKDKSDNFGRFGRLLNETSYNTKNQNETVNDNTKYKSNTATGKFLKRLN